MIDNKALLEVRVVHWPQQRSTSRRQSSWRRSVFPA